MRPPQELTHRELEGGGTRGHKVTCPSQNPRDPSSFFTETKQLQRHTITSSHVCSLPGPMCNANTTSNGKDHFYLIS
uniref:Uncharacterized protein n=1 Tax=Lepeophtheirus salmonis TaxID=72036 RepID=A0A0K2UDL5_LEPSM